MDNYQHNIAFFGRYATIRCKADNNTFTGITKFNSYNPLYWRLQKKYNQVCSGSFKHLIPIFLETTFFWLDCSGQSLYIFVYLLFLFNLARNFPKILHAKVLNLELYILSANVKKELIHPNEFSMFGENLHINLLSSLSVLVINLSILVGPPMSRLCQPRITSAQLGATWRALLIC